MLLVLIFNFHGLLFLSAYKTKINHILYTVYSIYNLNYDLKIKNINYIYLSIINLFFNSVSYTVV